MKKTLISAVVLAGSLGLYTEAYATCTQIQPFTTLDISMAVGRVVVRPSDAIGKVLVKRTFPINTNGSQYNCDKSGGTLEAVLTQNYPLSPSGGDSVYSTNIPGIGIRLYREAINASNFSGYYPYARPTATNTNYFLADGYFVVEIIKTAAETGSGTLVPGRYSRYNIKGSSTTPWLTSTVYGNAITIASSSCEIQGSINRTIVLPTVNTAGFKGVGSTQGEQPFDMNILCNGGKNPTGYEEKNQISLTYDYSTEGSNNSVLQNTAPVAEKAKGVAIQLLWNYQGKNDVIKKGDKLVLGTLNSGTSITYNVPMTARYYQSAAKMTAGKVKAQATMMINYD
ncbi:fimbrial protein [Acinetobacter pullicarnis]|uniref:fimbrial protein n=1 Tax=Acinetobacter pullicarnis TaxID=2576829 RepID=UPI0011221503|nr:fimbrial protein [Acinetobacter pullicarnis]